MNLNTPYDIVERAFSFSNQQMKAGNHYAAIMIQASLMEEVLRETRFMKIHSEMDFSDSQKLEESNRAAVKVYDDDFYVSIKKGEAERAITKALAQSLHKYRQRRNIMIHYTFEEGIRKKEAQKYVAQGNRLLRQLGIRVSTFRDKNYR